MTDNISARRDRAVGLTLLALAIIVAFVPRLEVAGQPISPFSIAFSWFCGAILLLSSHATPHSKPKLMRWGAAVLFVMGMTGPFVANLIDQSLGAN